MRLVGLVVGVHRGIVNLNVGAVLVRRQQRVAHFALLVLQGARALDLGCCLKVGNDDAVLQLRALKRTPQLDFERIQGDPRLRQPLARNFRRVLALDLESRLVAHGVAHIRFAHPVAEVMRALREQCVADHRLEQAVLQKSLLCRRNLTAQALLVLCLLIEPGRAGRLDRDLLAAGLSRIGTATGIEADDAVGPPRGENQREASQYDVHEPFMALQSVADALKHEWLKALWWGSPI